MEWLFGRKKSETKVDDAKEATQVVDGFVVYPPIPTDYEAYAPAQRGAYAPAQHGARAPIQRGTYAQYPVSGYPSLPGHSIPSTAAAQSVNHQSLPAITSTIANPLESIPFRLSSKLESPTHIDSDEFIQFGFFFSNLRSSLSSSELSYDFKLERSVLRETSLMNGL